MRPSQIRIVIFFLLLLVLAGWAIPTAANLIIEYNWWKEVAQINTWVSMLCYSIAPVAVGALVAFIALYVAHARGLHFAGVRQRDYPLYFRLVPICHRPLPSNEDHFFQDQVQTRGVTVLTLAAF